MAVWLEYRVWFLWRERQLYGALAAVKLLVIKTTSVIIKVFWYYAEQIFSLLCQYPIMSNTLLTAASISHLAYFCLQVMQIKVRFTIAFVTARQIDLIYSIWNVFTFLNTLINCRFLQLSPERTDRDKSASGSSTFTQARRACGSVGAPFLGLFSVHRQARADSSKLVFFKSPK